MKKTKIYLDTSVIGGCFDEEFSEDSIHLIEQIITGDRIGVISDITENEVSKAPAKVRDHFDSYKQILEILKTNSQVEDLAGIYLKEKIVNEKFRNDCLHIAYSTVFQIDLLVSWNFRHIVNYDKIIRFNSVNLKNGYQPLQIYSPREVIKQND
ncbi:MAG: PIN domain protein [Ignavibacteria bacterium]|nr:PIN domain protein [Ignavibacteria bacterium]